MGRSTQGFRITKDARSGIYKLRFRHRGRRFHLSTGTRNKKDAGVVAARVYAETISGNGRPTERVARRPLDAVAADWLDAIAPPIVSEDTWKYDLEFCRKKLMPHFRHMELITEVGVAFWYGFAFADLVVYIPLLAIGLIGHWRRRPWGRVIFAAALGITVYWPVVVLAAAVDARDASGWVIDETPFWIVLPTIAAWALWGLLRIARAERLAQ